MKNTQRGFVEGLVIAIGVLLALGLGVGAYFYVNNQNEELQAQVVKAEEIHQQLAEAQVKVATETSKLTLLQSNFSAQFPLQAAVQDQYINADNAVTRTNTLFNDPTTADPQIAVQTQTPLIETNIDNEREQINTMLTAWQQEANISFASTTNQVTITQIKNDADTIVQYVDNLSSIVAALSPDTSGISQTQIDSYQSLLTGVTTEVNNTIAALTQDQSIAPVPSNNTQAADQTTSDASQTSTTEQDIVTQENVVAQAEAQALALQTQLNQVVATIPPDNQPADIAVDTDSSTSTSATSSTDTTSQTSTTDDTGGSVPPTPSPTIFETPQNSSFTDPSLWSPFPSNLPVPGTPQPIQGADL